MLDEEFGSRIQVNWSKPKTKSIVIVLLSWHLVESIRYHPRNVNIENSLNSSLDNNTTEKLHKDWMFRNNDGVLFPALVNAGTFEMSTRVAFAPRMPKLPPSGGNVEKLSLEDLIHRHEKFNKVLDENNNTYELKRNKRSKKSKKGLKKRKARKRRHGHGKKRRRRSHRNRNYHYGSPISSCTGYSDWVQLTESYNQWEQRVIVLPYIEIKGRTMQQYFYETNCVNEESPCEGIDRKHYKSECVTKKILTYAYVRHPTTGEESWSYIQINGSCNCKLQRKIRHGQIRNILEHLK